MTPNRAALNRSADARLLARVVGAARRLLLNVEFGRRWPVAVFGQVARIVRGVPGSAVGIVPVGNAGGTNVSMFKRMPIALELQNTIDGGAPPHARA